ncbi:B12-binding domain-containing radical SAM protein [Aromatoleum petrolei]|uniref:Radical SAM protein n=1 Tax=Aromatoleum petrolei TaxID=76116 RepID=A0ABX1MU27_9RHOO|nr:radical SAM protein [Aromatoleum petrolei]NMF89831.1 radical SAM protein [Aromatoleum petrolei]QTQ36993.1 Radical SAM domain-containing protein [Aromatoleum petrolei]
MSGTEHPVVVLRIDREAGRHTGHPRHLHPALDLMYVQAGLEQALQVAVPLLDGWLGQFRVESFIARVLALKPRVAVIRAVTWCLEESVRVAAALRAAGVVTIAVGQQVQHVARTRFGGWNEAYDLAVAGEPEEQAPRLALRVLAGEDLAGLRAECRRRMDAGEVALVEAPHALPRPRFGRDALKTYAFPFPVRGRPAARWGYVLTAWGCPRPCRHCTAIVRKSVGRDLRVRPVGDVVDEVLVLQAAGAQAIAFEDDSLLVHRGRFLQLADELVRRGVGLPWMANARPDELDEERVAAAAAAGAVLLKVGVDSGSARLIERLGKTADGAGWIAATESAFERLDRAGIGSVALFMVGMPDETEADAEATLALARRIRPDYLQMQIYRPYPDVPLWGELPQQSRTHGAEYHYLTPATSCSLIPPVALAALQRRFYRRFYLSPGFVARHLARHWRHYLSVAGLARAPGALAYLMRGA